MTELMDGTAAKIVLSANRGDSVNRIADKIGVSYSWTYDWIERLEEARVIACTDNGIEVIDHGIRQQYAEMMAALYSRDAISQEDAYIIPHFAGMEFAYTEIDAAYVWTHGGYQIARTHDDYPVFIQVHDRDVGRWNAFFQQFDIEWVNGNPVIPLEDAVDQMMENRPAYEPALEIIAREYDIDIDASHHGAMTAD